jgi:hypothetical protein
VPPPPAGDKEYHFICTGRVSRAFFFADLQKIASLKIVSEKDSAYLNFEKHAASCSFYRFDKKCNYKV